VAISLVHAGFPSWSHLDGLEADEFVQVDTLPVDIALIKKAIHKAAILARLEASGSSQVAVSGPGPSMACGSVQRFASADGTALSLGAAVLEKAEADWQLEVQRLRMP